MKEKNKKVHLIGICGAGMSALAVLLKEAGYKVTGSDNNPYEPILGYLNKNKINFFKNYGAKNIPEGVDLVVIGKHTNLTPPLNQEVQRAFIMKKSGTKVQSLPETLAELSKNKNNLLAVGSFGKSTCTALLSWSLIKSKKNPSYFIGAVPICFDKSSHLGKGDDFIIEGDEYPSSNWDDQSKFLHFNPLAVLLTSAEHDHKNVFETEESYKEPYKKLVAKIPKNGLLVFSYNGENNKEITKYAKCIKVSYSLSNKKADWYAQNIKYGKETSFVLVHKGKEVVSLKTKLLGAHNIENIVGCGVLLLENKKITPKDFAKAVASFQGIKRRIELKSSKSSVLVYEGFGSSYSKAKSVFDALKLHFPNKNIITVFEPKTFSWRNMSAKKWYEDIFDTSEKVIILPPSKHGKNTHDQMSFEQIIHEVRKNHKMVYSAENEKETLLLLKEITAKNDIVALVSSGSLLGLTNSVPKLMEKMFKTQKLS